MRKVILDTSFIISAVKEKLDFFSWISDEGYKVFIPEQAIDELMSLGSQVSLNILEKNDFELVKIPGKDADTAIIQFAKKNPDVVVATLDKGLQKKIRNHKMIIRAKKKIMVM